MTRIIGADNLLRGARVPYDRERRGSIGPSGVFLQRRIPFSTAKKDIPLSWVASFSAWWPGKLRVLGSIPGQYVRNLVR